MYQTRKKEHKPKLLSLDTFRWGRGLPRERMGAKKFGMFLEAQGNQNFLGGISRGFCWDIPTVPEKFETKKVSVQFLAPSVDLAFRCKVFRALSGVIRANRNFE